MPVIRSEPLDAPARSCDTGVVLRIEGRLDALAGEARVAAATAVVQDRAARLEIDLCELTGFTADGACALAACRTVCAELPEGLHYRTGQGPGRDALLAAYADSSL